MYDKVSVYDKVSEVENPGDIFNEMNRLGGSLAMLNEMVDTLTKRLHPILGPGDTDGDAKDECSPRTDLGKMVRQHDHSARRAINTLRDVLSTLELP